MTSDNTTTPVTATGPVTHPVTGPCTTIHHAYQRHPDGSPGCCVCGRPREHRLHPHRFEPTFSDPRECMCGGGADAGQHQPSYVLSIDQPLTEADYAALAARWAEAQRTHRPMVVSPPIRITGRDPEPTPLLLAARSRTGRYAAMRAAVLARLGRGGDGR